MATLADVNDTLIDQNRTLDDVKVGIDGMKKSLANYLGFIKGKSGDELEKERETKGLISRVTTSGAQKMKDAAGGLSDRMKAGFGGIGNLLTAGGLAGLGATLGSALLRRGVPGLLMTTFADEIADYILGPDGDRELRNQLTQGLEFAGIGLLFGKRFALLSGLFGFFATDETWDELKKLTDSVDFKAWQTWIQENIIQGLSGLNKLFKGDFKGIWNEGEVLETMALIGGLATAIVGVGPIIATGKLLGKATGLLLWNPVTKAGVTWALSKIGGLASALVDSGVAFDATANRYRNLKTGRFAAAPPSLLGALSLSTFGAGATTVLGAFLGAATPILAISAIGYYTGEWFKTTQLYKDLKKYNDELVEKYGLEGQTAGDISAEAGATTEQLTGEKARPLPSVDDLDQLKATRQTYVKALESGAYAGTPTEELYKSNLTKIDAKIASAEAELERSASARENSFNRGTPIIRPTNNQADQIQQQRTTAESFRANEARMSGNVMGNTVNSGNTSVQNNQPLSSGGANMSNTVNQNDSLWMDAGA